MKIIKNDYVDKPSQPKKPEEKVIYNSDFDGKFQGITLKEAVDIINNEIILKYGKEHILGYEDIFFEINWDYGGGDASYFYKVPNLNYNEEMEHYNLVYEKYKIELENYNKWFAEIEQPRLDRLKELEEEKNKLIEANKLFENKLKIIEKQESLIKGKLRRENE